MIAFYRLKRPGGEGLTGCFARQELRDFLRDRADWPAGRYEVVTGSSIGLLMGEADIHWGFAVKDPDGAVELIPDRPG